MCNIWRGNQKSEPTSTNQQKDQVLWKRCWMIKSERWDHIKAFTKTAFFHLSHFLLSLRDTETFIRAFVSSTLDDCNLLFSALPTCSTKSLQLLHNSAAGIWSKSRKYEHLPAILASLHWLAVRAGADLKLLLWPYEAPHGLAARYLTELMSPRTPAGPPRSLSAGLLVVPS